MDEKCMLQRIYASLNSLLSPCVCHRCKLHSKATASPQGKEHIMGLVLTGKSREMKYPYLLIFNCALIALITSRLPHVLSIHFYKVINPFLLL